MESETFIDGESQYNFSREDNYSFKSILMRHLERITKLASVEFRGGYQQEKIIPVGGTLIKQQVYVPDTRSVYCNAVENLADLLFPHFDEHMETVESQIASEIETAHQELKELDQYRNIKLKLSKKLFRELCSFLAREKYLELGEVSD